MFLSIACLLLRLLNLHTRDMLHYVLILKFTCQKAMGTLYKWSMEQGDSNELIRVTAAYLLSDTHVHHCCWFFLIPLKISVYFWNYLASVALHYDGFLIAFSVFFLSPNHLQKPLLWFPWQGTGEAGSASLNWLHWIQAAGSGAQGLSPQMNRGPEWENR